MIEDDIYRTSSQYRLWSYTRSQLSSIHSTTNQLASERVRSAVRRVHAAKSEPVSKATHNGHGDAMAMDMDPATDPDIQTLTPAEELKIVQWGCSKIVEMAEAMTPRLPSLVAATAIQYLRRFYLTNSPMTYHPKTIMMCALFLATKAEHHYVPLSRFVVDLDGISEDDVKAPEFLVMQGLRFTLGVWHPMRGLEGAVLEMGEWSREGWVVGQAEGVGMDRVGRAADGAKKFLVREAQMTDAYFLYTPSQIWVSALMCADEALGRGFVDRKLQDLGDGAPEMDAMKKRLWAVLRDCVELLKSYKSPEEDGAERKEMRRIGKKLTVCQNPEKVDIVAVARAKAAEKREGTEEKREEKSKKRKVEEQSKGRDEDVFGASLRA